jgi:hypothetical protein
LVQLDPVGRLESDSTLLGKRLSVRKVHQIGALLRRLPAPHNCSSEDAPGFKRVLDAEVKRALRRSESDGEPLEPEEAGMDLGGPTYADNHKVVGVWIDRMLIARAFAESVSKAKSGETSTRVAA